MNICILILNLVLIVIPVGVLSKIKGDDIKLKSLNVHENLLINICELKLCGIAEEKCNLKTCMEYMLNTEKHGDCPVKFTGPIVSQFCSDDCGGFDYKCPDIQKCCWSGCHRKCEIAENLENQPLSILPPVPQNITIVSNEQNIQRTVQISWEMAWIKKPVYNNNKYIVETRSHVGSTFMSHKLSNWFVIDRFNLSHVQSGVKIVVTYKVLVSLKIGRWYEFRIVAFNENGTRGYSNFSSPFQLKEKPRGLPSPSHFAIEESPRLLSNHSVYTKVSWSSSISDYPIEKYEISWALFIAEGNGSLILEKSYVPESKRTFEFGNLLPDSKYYLQLRALSAFGRKRLRSPKEELFFNTTDALF